MDTIQWFIIAIFIELDFQSAEHQILLLTSVCELTIQDTNVSIQ